ncbi:hypothetical protein CKAH01_12807 [Colletotrichum kahawae]|uniref:Uncharacterized protein n=1 Tax=Colletotrichum kahawae TaxID=34407 RepID=A0AAD9YU35_COLKA|nr:hypothetical protein CKAH01_12807 [Colletotrichum kahawae]
MPMAKGEWAEHFACVRSISHGNHPFAAAEAIQMCAPQLPFLV